MVPTFQRMLTEQIREVAYTLTLTLNKPKHTHKATLIFRKFHLQPTQKTHTICISVRRSVELSSKASYIFEYTHTNTRVLSCVEVCSTQMHLLFVDETGETASIAQECRETILLVFMYASIYYYIHVSTFPPPTFSSENSSCVFAAFRFPGQAAVFPHY